VRADHARGKQCRQFAPCDVGVLIRSPGRPVCLHHPDTPVMDVAWLRARTAILVNAAGCRRQSASCHSLDRGVGTVGEEVAYVSRPDLLTYCSAKHARRLPETWKQTLPHHEAGGDMIPTSGSL